MSVWDFEYQEYSIQLLRPHELSSDHLELALDFEEIMNADLNSNYDREMEILDSRESRSRHMDFPPSERHKNFFLYAYKYDNGNPLVLAARGYANFRTSKVETNQDLIWVGVSVHPEHRNKGLGTSILNQLLHYCESINRNKISGGVYSGGPESLYTWITNRGLKQVYTENLSRLYHDQINWEFIEKSEASLNPKFDNERFELMSFTKLPLAQLCLDDDDFVTRLVDFDNEVENLIPLQDLALEDRIITVEDVRSSAKDTIEKKTGWESFRFYLVDKEADNKIIALSSTYFSQDKPMRAVGTGFTAVRKSYQRQGIATYLKIKIIRHFIAEYPHFEYIYTGNATTNEGMLAINESLGFQPFYQYIEYSGATSEVIEGNLRYKEIS